MGFWQRLFGSPQEYVDDGPVYDPDDQGPTEVPCDGCGTAGVVPCGHCAGTGDDPNDPDSDCPACGGAGGFDCGACAGEGVITINYL